MKRAADSKKTVADECSEPVRKSFLFGSLLVSVILIGTALMIGRANSDSADRAAKRVDLSKTTSNGGAVKKSRAGFPVARVAPLAQPTGIQPVTPAIPAQQLVDDLAKISDSKNDITPEQAARFKQNITDLVNQGPASVPAIEGFLKKNLNSDFGDIKGGDQVGYSSLRSGLIDALNQIGGPEAEAAMVGTLQTTATPSEILELSKDLEEQAPGQYRDQILAAANDAVNMASQSQLGENVEVGPAYHILETYRNAENPRNVATGETDAH